MADITLLPLLVPLQMHYKTVKALIMLLIQGQLSAMLIH
jgi:hypothetical protein